MLPLAEPKQTLIERRGRQIKKIITMDEGNQVERQIPMQQAPLQRAIENGPIQPRQNEVNEPLVDYENHLRLAQEELIPRLVELSVDQHDTIEMSDISPNFSVKGLKNFKADECKQLQCEQIKDSLFPSLKKYEIPDLQSVDIRKIKEKLEAQRL